jgi:predicted acetyltransferase
MSNKMPNANCFADSELASWYQHVQSAYITDCCFYGNPEKIYCFATIMYEGLNCGFMHYHIPKQHHAYFSAKYPELAQAVNQIHYIRTANEYRKNGYASQVLTFILNDMTAQGFRFVWLRADISSLFYQAKGFCTFTEALKKICTNFDDFAADYEDKVEKMERLDRHFGDRRLVYICETKRQNDEM